MLDARIRPRLPDLVVLLAAILLFVTVVRGDDLEGNPNAGPVELSATAGAVVTMSGDAGTTVLPTGFVDVDGPLVLGKSSIARVHVALGISTEPGASLELADPTTFKSAEVTLSAYRVVGRLALGDQEISTGLVALWGFASRLPGVVEPAERLVRHYGGGVRLEERKSGAYLVVAYGRDEAVGPRGWGTWMLWGQVPIAGTKGALLIVGDASLAVGPRNIGVQQRDIFRLGVSVDLGAALRAMR